MQKLLLLFSPALFCCTMLQAQVNSVDPKILQSQYFTDGSGVSLVADSGWTEAMYNRYNFSLRYMAIDGSELSRIPLNFLDTSLSGNPLTEINIHFMDHDNGFLYGYETGYGYLTFLFRTADGGKTWRHINLSGVGTVPRLQGMTFLCSMINRVSLSRLEISPWNFIIS